MQGLRDLRVNSLWKRLRRSILLLLQLLVAALQFFGLFDKARTQLSDRSRCPW